MPLHFHELKIKKIKKETQDCVSLSFEVPQELSEKFQFKQGQNITVRTTIDGEEVRRSYSICSAPYENELRVAVKKVETGKFSSWSNEKLKPGDVLEVMPPTGRFYTELNPSHQKKYIAFAAGSGITPVISLIKTTLKTELQSNFTLVYSNRSRSSIIFFEELEGLKNKYIDRLHIIYLLSREQTDTPVNFGRINEAKLNELNKLIKLNKYDEYFVCGPEEMIFTVNDFLEARGVDKKQIHFELFHPRGIKIEKANMQLTEKSDEGPKSKITVKLDGRAFDFDLSFNSDSILDAALKQGADLPFACKGGVCSTCKARIISGEVKMDSNYALEPDELAKGFILTCQSHPVTDKVIIDYDVK